MLDARSPVRFSTEFIYLQPIRQRTLRLTNEQGSITASQHNRNFICNLPDFPFVVDVVVAAARPWFDFCCLFAGRFHIYFAQLLQTLIVSADQI